MEAQYIAEMVDELKGIAAKAELTDLAYLLGMAVEEAKQSARRAKDEETAVRRSTAQGAGS